MRKPRPNFATAIRFSPETHDRLVAESEARDLSINWLVNRAVEHMLANLVPVDEVRLIRSPETTP